MAPYSSTTEQYTDPKMTRHAAARIRQRGLTDSDLKLIRAVGEPVEDGFVMTNRAIDLQIQKIRSEVTRIERLRGVALIECADTVITVYRADKKRVRRLLAAESIRR